MATVLHILEHGEILDDFVVSQISDSVSSPNLLVTHTCVAEKRHKFVKNHNFKSVCACVCFPRCLTIPFVLLIARFFFLMVILHGGGAPGDCGAREPCSMGAGRGRVEPLREVPRRGNSHRGWG